MSKWQLTAVVGLGIVTLGLSLPEPEVAAQKPKRAIGWHTDYAQARALARQTGKPLFVVFRCQP